MVTATPKGLSTFYMHSILQEMKISLCQMLHQLWEYCALSTLFIVLCIYWQFGQAPLASCSSITKFTLKISHHLCWQYIFLYMLFRLWGYTLNDCWNYNHLWSIMHRVHWSSTYVTDDSTVAKHIVKFKIWNHEQYIRLFQHCSPLCKEFYCNIKLALLNIIF